MTTLESTRLVAGREIRETMRRKSFWAVVVVLALAATAAVVVPGLLDEDETKYRIAVVGEPTGVNDALIATGRGLDAKVEVSKVSDADAARRQVADGDVDLAVVTGDRARLIVEAGEHEQLVGAVQQVMVTVGLAAALAGNGAAAGELRAALSEPPRVDEVDRDAAERKGASFILSLVLYILLLSLMVQAANGIAIEKSSRISEVLLAVVRPGPLLLGKVVGISVIGLVSFGAGIVPVAIALAAGGDLPPGLGGALAGGLLWFALGLVLYLTLAGTLGALAERQEEAGVIVAPLTFLLIGTFIVTQSATDSTLGAVLSYVPLTSPIVTPARIAEGIAGWPEIVLSALLLVTAIGAAGRLGAVVYSRAVVRSGRRIKLREVLRPVG